MRIRGQVIVEEGVEPLLTGGTVICWEGILDALGAFTCPAHISCACIKAPDLYRSDHCITARVPSLTVRAQACHQKAALLQLVRICAACKANLRPATDSTTPAVGDKVGMAGGGAGGLGCPGTAAARQSAGQAVRKLHGVPSEKNPAFTCPDEQAVNLRTCDKARVRQREL